MQYYINGGLNVHALLIDASKAFDKDEYVKLFDLFLKRGMCVLWWQNF